MNRIETLRAPLFVSWQLTRDCDLTCVHCCTDSAPGKRLTDELTADEAMALAEDIVRNDIPYVMLCGGEPLIVPHFFAVAEILGTGGTMLKIETNAQTLDEATVQRLARLPIRSIQVSLDGDTQDVYGRQRPGASLAKAHDSCRMIREAGLPLEITFAPTRVNIHQAEAVIDRARALGAFRFNTGHLMRIGRAARLWHKLEPSPQAYAAFRAMLDRQSLQVDDTIEICHLPFTVEDGLQQSVDTPPATMLVLPNGLVKVAAAIGFTCADLRRDTVIEAWNNYRAAWRTEPVLAAIKRAISAPAGHEDANTWMPIPDGVI